jgi:hypothetical protein
MTPEYKQWVAECEAAELRWRTWLFWNTACYRYLFLSS